jgi:transcription initiation factor TFIIE subunit alpha
MSSDIDLDPTLVIVLIDFGGQDAIKIAHVLQKLGTNEEITDEKLADKSGVRLNIVRKILYILNENKLTSFKRQRDKKSGWFVYYWRHTFDSLPQLLEERRRQVVEKLNIRMKFEEDHYFFKCNLTCSKRYVFEEAMDKDFRCPECQTGQLVEDNNKELIKMLKEKIVLLRSQC